MKATHCSLGEERKLGDVFICWGYQLADGKPTWAWIRSEFDTYEKAEQEIRRWFHPNKVVEILPSMSLNVNNYLNQTMEPAML